MQRYDWARNAAGLTDPAYWRGNLNPRPTVDWYLRYIDEAVLRATDGGGEGAGKVVLLAHSAGGWLGRVWMDDVDFYDGGMAKAARVARFVTLGSPHRPPPEGAEGIVDQTRGILSYVERFMPGAFHAEALGTEYVTVAGTYIKGREWPLGERESLLESMPALAAGLGYKQVCGDARADGDGITPVACAHLPGDGVLRVDVEGCYHSPLGAGDGRRWYGEAPHLEQWAQHVDFVLEPASAA